MVTPSFSIQETDKGFSVTDTTDYSSEQYIGTYALNDYTTNPSLTPNTVFKTTIINVAGTEIFNSAIEYRSDGTGDIIDSEQAYNYIVEQINESGTQYKARLNKNGSTAWRTWRLEIYSFDVATDGHSIAVAVTGGNLIPLTTNFTGTPSGITFRNLLVLDPKGEVYDLGGTAQVTTIKFNYTSYLEGSIITLSFCNDSIVYTVVNTDTDCIIADLIALLDTQDVNLAYYTINADKDGQSIVLTQTSVGVPFSVTISTDDTVVVDPFTVSETIANVPTMSLPTNATEGEVVEVEELDKGGKYTVSMTIGSVCDNGTTTQDYYSWVYDNIQLDCCFDKMATKETCCAATTEQILKTSTLRNVIYGIEVAKRDNEDPAKIQSLYDLGWDSCDCNPCCSDCA